MSSYGPHIVAKLSDLRAVGRIDLPQMQYVYGRLNRDVASTTASGEAAFGGSDALDHANDPLVDSSGHVADDPEITKDLIRQCAQAGYREFPPMFTAFATPDPAGIQPAIDALWGVAYALDDV